MKQLRRPRTKQALQTASTSRRLKENPLFPCACPFVPVSVDGEAEKGEHTRDVQLIKLQLAKQTDVKALMRKTFAFRHSLVVLGRSDVSGIMAMYPHLDRYQWVILHECI